MNFVDNLDKDEYIKFWSENDNSHFLQSYGWGQASIKNRNQTPYYVGLRNDEGKLVAAALLLKTKLIGKLFYFYCPRGFTIDYNDFSLLKEFTSELENFMKKTGAVYLVIDPAIMYQTINLDAEKIDGPNNYKLYNELIELNYLHKGFNKLYEGNQPRYTFRSYFNKLNSIELINSSISKSYMRNIKRSYNYDIKIEISEDIEKFHSLIKIISNKNDFSEYSKNYYQNVYDEFKKEKLIKIFTASINPQKLINKFSTELENEKNEDRINKLNKDINYFEELKELNEHVICSLICTYSSAGAWSLYIGNDRTAEVTGTINRLYYEFIVDAFNDNYKFADLFGTVGDPKTKYKNLSGIFEHKRMLGGDYIEFIGEFDLVNKKFIYKLLPIMRKIKRIWK